MFVTQRCQLTEGLSEDGDSDRIWKINGNHGEKINIYLN